MMVVVIIGIVVLLIVLFIIVNRLEKMNDSISSIQLKLAKVNSDWMDDELTLDDIANMVRLEGYIPTIESESNCVFFKVNGDYVRAWYENGRFTLAKQYGLTESDDLETFGLAARRTEADLFLAKVYVYRTDNNEPAICFEAPLLVTSTKEFKKHFSRCLQILGESINLHRYHLNELEKQKAEAIQPGQFSQGEQPGQADDQPFVLGGKKVVS
jgi:hypothetical protein